MLTTVKLFLIPNSDNIPSSSRNRNKSKNNHSINQNRIPPNTSLFNQHRFITDSNKNLNKSYETSEGEAVLFVPKSNPQKPVARQKIEKVYVKDAGVQCNPLNDAMTQTPSLLSINGEAAIAELIKNMAMNMYIKDNKPIFRCKEIAEKLSHLTGISITPNWVLASFN